MIGVWSEVARQHRITGRNFVLAHMGSRMDSAN